MNKKFMLAAVMGCTMALGFSACSDDDENEQNDGYTEMFRLRYYNSEEDSVELETVRAAYAKALNSNNTTYIDSITISATDSVTCLKKFDEMLKQADDVLQKQTFTSYPRVIASNRCDSVIFEQVYGPDDNSYLGMHTQINTFKCINPDTKNNDYTYQKDMMNQFAGDIRPEPNSDGYYMKYLMETPDLMEGAGYWFQYIDLVAANNYRRINADKKWEEVTMDPITDVVIWNATQSETQYTSVPKTMTYNDRTYKLCDKVGDGNKLYLYFTQDKGTGKRLLMTLGFTGYRWKRTWTGSINFFSGNVFKVQNVASTLDDFKNNTKITNEIGTGDDHGLEMVPMIKTDRYGINHQMNDHANLHEGKSGASYLYLMLNWKYDASY